MDEINAALQADEGFDDYSIADFRKFLLDRYGKQGWKPADARWQSVFKIDLADPASVPDETMETFQYRAYLKSRGLAEDSARRREPVGRRVARLPRRSRRPGVEMADRRDPGLRRREGPPRAHQRATAWPGTSISRCWACGGTGGRRSGRIDLSESQTRAVGFDGGGRLGHGRQNGAGRAVPRLGLRRIPLDGSPARGPAALDSCPRGGNLRRGRVLRLPGPRPVRQRLPPRRHARRRSLGRAGSTISTRISTSTPNCWASSRWKPTSRGSAWPCGGVSSPPSLILHVINRQAEDGKPNIGRR